MDEKPGYQVRRDAGQSVPRDRGGLSGREDGVADTDTGAGGSGTGRTTALEDTQLNAGYGPRSAAVRQRIGAVAATINSDEGEAGIDVDRLWQAAQTRHGRIPSPSPDDSHFTGLRHLAAAMEQSGRYDRAGLRIARHEILGWLSSWSSFRDDLEIYPGISGAEVGGPVLIAGFGRTGSTFLHNLLALDPGMRAPLLWELWNPSPPPQRETYETDPRIAVTQRRLQIVRQMAPLIPKIHPMDAQMPDECHWLMRHSPFWAMTYGAPRYWEWLKSLGPDGLRELYAHYRLQVQHLLLLSPRGRWLSKSFCHLHYMPVLWDVFPDAKVVRLHRDPVHAVPSLCSLAASYRSIYGDLPDLDELGETVLDMFVDGMDRSIGAETRVGPDRFMDIPYGDLVADPVSTVRRIYRHFGFAYPAEFDGAVIDYVTRGREKPLYRHVYEPEQFGLSPRRIRDRSERYRAWVRERLGDGVGDG
jgi:hypothetical protein